MRRLGISLLLVVTMATIGSGWMIDQLFDRLAGQSSQTQVQSLEAMSTALARALEQTPQRDAFIRSWNASKTGPRISLSEPGAFPVPPQLRAILEHGQPLTLESDRGISVHSLLPGGRQIVSLDWPVHAPPTTSSLSLAMTLLFYLGVIVLVLLWLLPLLVRLSRLTRAARGFGEGALHLRVKTSATSFIRAIEQEFNSMAQRIQTLVQDNKLLASAVSHDLRTPLARLRFGIDALCECDDPASRERYQQHLSRDIATMESLVELLLVYARLEYEMPRMDATPIGLTALLADIVERADGSGKTVCLEAAGHDCTIEGNERTLRMLAENLVQNAVHHAKGRIRVFAEENESGVTLSVEDDGPGIPPAQRAHVSKPFIRGERERIRKGHGLGLAIVARVAQWHRAQVEIDDSPALQGARIRVHFGPMKA